MTQQKVAKKPCLSQAAAATAFAAARPALTMPWAAGNCRIRRHTSAPRHSNLAGAPLSHEPTHR